MPIGELFRSVRCPLLTATLESQTEEVKSWLVAPAEVVNEPAIFADWQTLLQFRPQRGQFCHWLERTTVC